MYRTRLPRIYELKDLPKESRSHKAYFQEFEMMLEINEQKMQAFIELETKLQQLDPSSWDEIKQKAAPLLQIRDKRRSWHQLFEMLNEVRGYIYLSRIGCCEIRFVPPSTSKRIKNPDLEATLDSIPILCEVKTINISDKEIDDFNRLSLMPCS